MPDSHPAYGCPAKRLIDSTNRLAQRYLLNSIMLADLLQMNQLVALLGSILAFVGLLWAGLLANLAIH